MPDFCRYSKIDSERFGKRIHRADLRDAAQVAELEEHAKSGEIDMIVARCPAESLPVVHALAAAGHLLMDSLVFYRGPTRHFEHATWPASIRPATAGDRESLRGLASAAFADYGGHYHSDPRLDSELATLAYVDWCLSCVEAPDHAMWVATKDDVVSGFMAIQRRDGAAEIRLNAVAPEFQRQGVYDSLLKASGQALFRQGVEDVSVSTQITNFAPQKVWARNGMSIRNAVYTFHKWYDA